jgi:hypothetical protein
MKEQKKPLIPKEALPKDLISHLENLKKRKEKDVLFYNIRKSAMKNGALIVKRRR